MGEMISIIISTGVSRFWMSRKMTFNNDKNQTMPMRDTTLSSQIQGRKTTVQLNVPIATAPTSVAVIPTTIVACDVSTAFTGARSIGKTVLLSTDLFVRTDVTPLDSASAV